MSKAPFTTPEFARIQVRLGDKPGLTRAAKELRNLAHLLDTFADGTLPDATARYLAWGSIKSASQDLRNET